MLSTSCETPTTEDKESKKNDVTEMNLIGKVKSVKEFSYDIKEVFGKAEKGERNFIDEFEMFFDEKGKLTKKVFLNSLNGEIKNTETFEYKDNLLIESNYYSTNDSLLSKTLYKYDLKKKLELEEHYYGNGDLNYKWEYKYNKDNLDSLRLRYDYNNKVDYKIINVYEGTNKISEERYRDNDSIIQKLFFKYDKGFKVEEKWIFADGSGSKFMFEYDDDIGNVKKVSRFDLKDSLYGIEEFEYDNDKNLTSQIYRFSDGSLSSKQTMKYDDNKKRNITEFIVFNSDDSPIQNQLFVYEYDNTGNWISKTIYFDGKAERIISRTIEYYKQTVATNE